MLKTYWHKLTEEQQIKFFDFYIACKFGGHEICDTCPESEAVIIFNHDICYKLFGYKHDPFSNLPRCPCRRFGHKAFKALERTLREEGWID